MTGFTHLDIIYHNEPDIMEVVYKDNTPEAVDEYAEALLQYADKMRQIDKLSIPLLLIVDLSQSGMFPLEYGVSKVTTVLPQIIDVEKLCLAYISDNPQDRFVLGRLNYFASARDQDIRRVFRTLEREAAVQWLISHLQA